MSDRTLLFMATVEADAGDMAIVEVAGVDQPLIDEILGIAVGHATPVEVHQAGTAERLAKMQAERDEARADLAAARVELARANTSIQLAPDAPKWVIAMLDDVAKGRVLEMRLDNDCQTLQDCTDADKMTDEQFEDEGLPELETPESPHEMIVDLLKAVGVKAEGV